MQGIHVQRKLVPASSQIVLCVCVFFFWLSFPELYSQFQTGCSTKLMRCCSVAARHLHRVVSAGASDSPESIWNPSCTQKAPGKHWRPRYPAESHCAAVRCSYGSWPPEIDHEMNGKTHQQRAKPDFSRLRWEAQHVQLTERT